MTEPSTAAGIGLSTTGLARREAMKVMLTGILRQRRRRRRMAQAACALLLLGLGARTLQPPRPAPVAPIAAPRCWTVVHDDPTVLLRCRAADITLPGTIFVDDAELPALLAAAGRDAGIVQIGDRIRVAAQLDDWRLDDQP